MMEKISKEKIMSIVEKQRCFFKSKQTLSAEFRIEQLNKLNSAIDKWENKLYEAIYKDLHKSEQETYLTEISIVRNEIKAHLKHLRKWMKPSCRRTPLSLFPSSSKVICEPLGCTLIVAPWNYPIHLLLNPLVGSISSGCTAVLKPSPYVPEVSMTLQNMIRDTFPEEYVAIVQGNREVNTMLFEQRFDLIFLTGSPSLGRAAMKYAAEHLTPLILELGGKSPCIVSEKAEISVAARRIVWGKTMNSGQTCIAPDYLFVHESIKSEFLKEFEAELKKMYGEDIRESEMYARIVHDSAFDRIVKYLDDGKILYGGRHDKKERFIEPVILEVESGDVPVMQEEIFGPVFPLMTYRSIEEVISFVNEREKPLALYYYGDTPEAEKVLTETSSGGACINDCLLHVANDNLPFGGVGNSGMGRYHGKDSFLAFSNIRSVVISPKKIDVPFRYYPQKFWNIIKRIV